MALFHGFGQLPIDPGAPVGIVKIIACGWIAVDLFFVLSGYIISYVHQSDFQRFSWGAYARFLKLRIARIYPAHLAMALLWLLVIAGTTIFLPSVLTPDLRAHYNGKTLVYALTLLNGWGIPGSEGWNLPSWSVSSEWFAYLTFALVALCANRLRSPRSFVVLGVLAMGFQFMLPVRGELVSVQTEFLLGCCVYGLGQSIVASRRYDALCAASLIAILCLATRDAHKITVFWMIVCFAPLVLGLHKSTWIGEWLLGSRLPVYLGEISYSLYLAHSLVIVLLRQVFHHMTSPAFTGPFWPAFRLATYLCAVIAAGHILYTYVEKPSRNYLSRRWQTGVQQAGVPIGELSESSATPFAQ